MSTVIPLRLGLQQRVFPAYRAPFFNTLARSCTGGLSVFAGEPMVNEALGQPGHLRDAQYVPARNVYIGEGALLLVWQFGLLDWLERWNPDVLVMEANPRNASTNAALRWMHAKGRPVIGWGLGAPPIHRKLPGPFPRLFNDSRRQFLGQFDALIAYSHTGMDQFVATGYPVNRVFLAPNAATPRPTQPPQWTERVDDRPTILFVGRLQPRKRVDVLLRACAQLPETIRPRLWIVGEGPERSALQTLAREVYPQAEFFGEKHDAELTRFYQGADLFVLPGTGGLAVQQAMSHGLPVLVAEADGTQADLVRPENGWLLPPGDESACVRAFVEALSDRERLRKMGMESYRIVAEEINLERMVEVFAAVIKTVKERSISPKPM